jgi:chitinase domain-containing protein 1
MKILLNYVLVIALVVACVSATINPSKNKKSKQKAQQAEVKIKVNVGPQEKSVYERNLVDNEPLASEIIAESGTYFKHTSLKNFNGTVLGYVTPVSENLIDFFRSKLFIIKF